MIIMFRGPYRQFEVNYNYEKCVGFSTVWSIEFYFTWVHNTYDMIISYTPSITRVWLCSTFCNIYTYSVKCTYTTRSEPYTISKFSCSSLAMFFYSEYFISLVIYMSFILCFVLRSAFLSYSFSFLFNILI